MSTPGHTRSASPSVKAVEMDEMKRKTRDVRVVEGVVNSQPASIGDVARVGTIMHQLEENAKQSNIKVFVRK